MKDTRPQGLFFFGMMVIFWNWIRRKTTPKIVKTGDVVVGGGMTGEVSEGGFEDSEELEDVLEGKK